MSKQQSILNFFGKSSQNTPKKNSTNSTPTSQKKPFGKTDLNQSSNKKVNKNNRTEKIKFDLVEKEAIFNTLDLVWARLDGYPHWPAIICEHPETKSICKTLRKKTYFNVQFFDNPPQRAWIFSDDCINFTSEKHPTLNTIKDKNLENSIQWAKNALKMNKDDRNSLIAELQLSDEENELIDEESDNQELSPILKKSKRNRKRKFESDDENELDSKKKKTLFNYETDDSEEYVPDKKDYSSSESDDTLEEEAEKDEEDLESDLEDLDNSVSFKNKKSGKNVKKNKKLNISTKINNEPNKNQHFETKEFTHLSFDFLKPQFIKDKEGRRPDDPEYDPKTLFVPRDFLNSQTPAHKQWWKIKSENFDTVLFFKMGKFYELFHMDAVIICTEDNLVYMRGDYAHAGFPEPAFPRFANNLIEKGYKVARVEQTETPEQKEKRCKANASSDKVVMREMCKITSKGTRCLGLFENEIKNTYSSYLMAITEKFNSENIMITGVCFLDSTIGKIYLSQFLDDKYSSLLRTIISHFPPVELLLEKDAITTQTLNTIKNCLPNIIITYLKSNLEFWSSRATLKFLFEGPYFKKKILNEESYEIENYELDIPESIKNLLDPADNLNLTVQENYDLAMKAFGACVYQLKRNLIEEDVLSMRKIEYLEISIDSTNNLTCNLNQDYIILDSVTIKNLELFENSIGTYEGSLLHTVDFCSTKFGKRTLREWICKPLYNQQSINDRLEAVENLLEFSFEDLNKYLKNLPDLERMFCKIHIQSLSNRSKNHPESRAVMFEANCYNKKKINEFIQLIDAFRVCDDLVVNLKKSKEKITSKLLISLINYEQDGGKFPYIRNVLEFFDVAFDHRIAKEQGKIVPKKGVNKPFEKATENISNVIKELDNYLKEQTRYFGSKLKYVGNGKNRYQIEIPENLSKKVPSEFELTSSRKGFKRYQTSSIRSLLMKLKEFEEKKEEAMQESMRLIFESFDSHINSWIAIVKCISTLDCLISFAKYTSSLKAISSCCRPELLNFDLNPIFIIKEGKHPCLINRLDNFMANDINLDEKLMLLTGPNMGGKSTLMRQTGLIAILAHIGCFVPAKQCKLTLIDRIFTRLGASDRILEGESTFYVELSETSTIIKHATNKSLVLLDELGRGTSTYDGTAIACSVVQHLSENIKCSTMFSTHYHTLLEEFKCSKQVIFTHMACMVENEDDQDPTKETITFLYKLISGPCPNSYGFNAARLADIPENVIKKGFDKAKSFESRIESIKLLSKLVHNVLNEEEAKKLIKFLMV